MLRSWKGHLVARNTQLRNMHVYGTCDIQKSATLVYNLQMSSLKQEVFGEKYLPTLNPEKQVG